MIHGIPAPEEDDFATEIVAWSIKEVLYGDNTEPTRHLVGYADREGRVSSAIQMFDSESRVIETRSGRQYKLHGKPGDHPDARYVWLRWKNFNKAQDEKDVTSEYWDAET